MAAASTVSNDVIMMHCDALANGQFPLP